MSNSASKSSKGTWYRQMVSMETIRQLARADDVQFSRVELELFIESPVWQAIQRGCALRLAVMYQVLKNPEASLEGIKASQGQIEALEWLLAGPDAMSMWLSQSEDKEPKKVAEPEQDELLAVLTAP